MYRTENKRYGDVPATQFPTPALNDWSKSNALIGQLRLSILAENSSSVAMFNKGSNPSKEMGGSLIGSLQSRMRPNRRGSTNATIVSSFDDLSGSLRYSMNCKHRILVMILELTSYYSPSSTAEAMMHLTS